MSLRSISSRSPPQSLSQQTSKSDNSNKLMNRKQLFSVIVDKFVKDYPQIDEQTIKNSVQEYMLNLDSKINELNLKELKNIIKELALQQSSFKKQTVLFKLQSSFQSPTSTSFNDQKSQGSLENIRENKFNQVKKVNYPPLNPNYRTGKSLSPQNLSTLSSFKEGNSNNSTISRQIICQNDTSKIKGIQVKENDNKQIVSSHDLQSLHQQSMQSVGIKSILKKVNRSLSPLQDKRMPPLNDTQKQNNSNKLLQIKTNSSSQNFNKGKFQEEQSKQSKCSTDLSLSNQSEAQQSDENSKKARKLQQIQLDENIKGLQRNQVNLLGISIGNSNKNSYWSYLDKIQNKDIEQIKYQNQNEWKDKFEEIKTIRQEHQIKGNIIKQKRNIESVQSNQESDEDSFSQITSYETVKGFDYNKQKGNLLETISQQQYIDINYAENVKKNAEKLAQEEQQQKLRKKEIQKYLKECYDLQIVQKQIDKKEEIQKGKEFIVFQKIIEEQEQRERHNKEINQTIKQARQKELTQKEYDRQSVLNKKLNIQTEVTEKYQKELQEEQDQVVQRKKNELKFYQKAINEYQKENKKAKMKADEKEKDKLYMENYTNYLDEQEEQRLKINQQRQKELQEFLKKQAESHQKIRDKKKKEEEREYMKLNVDEYAECNLKEIKDQENYKKQLKNQLRDFLTQQIEEKKEIQLKSFIDYDKIQLKACQKYNEAQNNYENQINELKKQQEIENFQFLKEQIKQNQLKNTKYFYPLAFSSILDQKNQSS